MNTRIEDVDQWLVQSVRDNSTGGVLLEKRPQNNPEPDTSFKRVKLEHASGHVITFTGCRPCAEEENVSFY